MLVDSTDTVDTTTVTLRPTTYTSVGATGEIPLVYGEVRAVWHGQIAHGVF